MDFLAETLWACKRNIYREQWTIFVRTDYFSWRKWSRVVDLSPGVWLVSHGSAAILGAQYAWQPPSLSPIPNLTSCMSAFRTGLVWLKTDIHRMFILPIWLLGGSSKWDIIYSEDLQILILCAHFQEVHLYFCSANIVTRSSLVSSKSLAVQASL